MLCCTLFNNVVLHPVNNCCQQPLFTVVHVQQPLFNRCWQRSTSFFINYCQLLFQQHCNNYFFLSTSNNYWSNNTYQHCQFNNCCWTLITTLFRRCWTNNVASTWSIFARVRVEAFSVLFNFSSASIGDAINLLLENVLNGEFAQRLADVIYVKVKISNLILTCQSMCIFAI